MGCVRSKQAAHVVFTTSVTVSVKDRGSQNLGASPMDPKP